MYISDPTTNSETTNPEFFMIFLANQIFFDEKRIRNKLTMFICKLVLFNSWKFKFGILELVVGFGEQDNLRNIYQCSSPANLTSQIFQFCNHQVYTFFDIISQDLEIERLINASVE